MNKSQKILTGLSLSAISFGSFAAVPVAVTTAFTDAGADVATIGGAVLLIVVGIVVFKMLRRAA